MRRIDTISGLIAAHVTGRIVYRVTFPDGRVVLMTADEYRRTPVGALRNTIATPVTIDATAEA